MFDGCQLGLLFLPDARVLGIDGLHYIQIFLLEDLNKKAKILSKAL
jgi:hypothetical protein